MQAAVVTTRENSHGEQVLVAYVVQADKRHSTQNSRKSLAARLRIIWFRRFLSFLTACRLPVRKIDWGSSERRRERPDVETLFAFPRTPGGKYLTKVLGPASGPGSGRYPMGFWSWRGLAARQPADLPGERRLHVKCRSARFSKHTVAEMAVES